MGAGVSTESPTVGKDSKWGQLVDELETMCKAHTSQDPLVVDTFRGSQNGSENGEGRRRSSVLRKESSLGKRVSSQAGEVQRTSSVVGFANGASPPGDAARSPSLGGLDPQPGILRSPQMTSFIVNPAEGGRPIAPLEQAPAPQRDSGPKVAPKPGRAQLTKVKKMRKEFFSQWKDESPPKMECSYIGLCCAAISYLLEMRAESSGQGRLSKNISVEDMFFTSRLPLYYMGKSNVTLSELYDICREFVDHDPRCQGIIDVQAHHLEATLVEGEVEQGERANETGDRGPMPLAQFRTVITDDTQGLKTITIFNYDPYVVEQEKLRVDDTDSESDDECEATVTSCNDVNGLSPPTAISTGPSQVLHSLTRYKHTPESEIGPDNDGSYSLLSEFNAATGTCTVLDARIGDDVHLTENSCPLPALYKACLTQDKRVKRCRGFLQFTILAEEGEDEDDDSPSLVKMFPSDLVLGHGPKGIPLISVCPRVSKHLVCFAYALHLVRGLCSDDSGEGVNIRGICTTMDFSLPIVVNQDLGLLEAFAYFSQYLRESGSDVWATVQPVRKKTDSENAPPTLSMMDFHDVLVQATERNDTVEKVMIVKFDLRCAHSLLNIASPGTAHYAILQSYDPDNQTVTLLDVEPARFSQKWSTTLQRLHRAIIGHGYIMVYKPSTGGFESSLQGSCVTIKRQDTMVKNLLTRITFKPPLPKKYTCFFEYPPEVMAVTSLSAALNIMVPEKLVMTKDIVYELSCDPSFLIERRMSLNDLHRVLVEYLVHSGRDKELTAVAVNFDRMLPTGGAVGRPRPRVGYEEFVETLSKHVVGEEGGSGQDSVMLLQCAKKVLREHSGGEGGEYLILHDTTKDDNGKTVAVVSDCHKSQYDRYLYIPLDRLYEGMCTFDSLAHRARGYILISKGTLPRFYVHGKKIELSQVPQNRHFSLPQCPHLNGVAVALTTLGHPCCEEDIFYGAYTCLGGEKFRRGSAIFPWQQLKVTMSSLAERMTVTAVAKMVMKFESACRRDLIASTIIGSSKDDFVSLLDDATSPIANFLLVCIYTSDIVHRIENPGKDARWNIGCGIIKDYDAETNLVHIVDANSTRYGSVWSTDVDTFYEALCLSDADRGENGLVKIGKGQQTAMPKRKSIVEHEFFADTPHNQSLVGPGGGGAPAPQFVTSTGAFD
eukprot:TRINITY_DN13454_c0_g1_i1.p1 TRINITY_DN13454_c0_g1~~TRINITY_DN13454_c0_g1_i1.p1  ORF type:complete len:1171 (+),score=459.18 TRINITY_DN13454_c0_g1_i1:139-3651(+)